MKKIIAIAVVAGLASLGFAFINEAPEMIPSAKFRYLEKTDFSHKLDETRLACWD